MGKTRLAAQLPDATLFNCDLPSVQRMAADPESLYASVRTGTVIFDEVHRLRDPSEVLKIGADMRGGPRILATGSSTLAALSAFRDSLAGRKRVIALQPVLVTELPAFGNATLDARLLHGGLPQRVLSGSPDPDFHAEWLDSFFARDVSELFRIERRKPFLLLARALLRQSGGMATVTTLAKECGASRPTVMAWLEALRVTQFLHEVPPYHGGRRGELVKQPKLYAFDTGFVAHERGWDSLRAEDRGHLWEHVVLEHLLFLGAPRGIFHWRSGVREVDFVLPGAGGEVTAIECKSTVDAIEVSGIAAFRESYPKGRNIVVCPRVPQAHRIERKGIRIAVVDLGGLARALGGADPD